MMSEYVRYDWIQTITDFIGFILNLLNPVLIFIGEMILILMNFLLNIFPDNILWLYIIIAIGLAVAGLIVNIKWPGLEYTSVFQRQSEPEEQPEPSEGY